jgi:hypothetical protein
MWRRGFRLEIAVCLVVSVTFILAISAYWGWNGGQVDGPRYLVPMVPFLALPAVFLLDFLPRRPLSWLLVAPLAGWSLFAAWTQFLGGLLFPTSWLRDPIGQYSLPALGRNEIAPNAGYFLGLRGWQSLLPLLLILAAVVVLPSIPPLLKFLLKRRSRSTASSPFDPGLATE